MVEDEALLGGGGGQQRRRMHAAAAALLLVAVSTLAMVALQQQLGVVVLASPEVDAIERNALNVLDVKEQQETPPERWTDPDPWAVDSDDFSNDFKGEGGQLSEFFSEDPKVLPPPTVHFMACMRCCW